MFPSRDLFSEIALLSAENRKSPRVEIEKRLVDLRFNAFRRLEIPLAPPEWPEFFQDPFPGETGIPEIDFSRLNANLLRDTIHTHGSLLVRNLLSSKKASQLVTQIDGAFASLRKKESNRLFHAFRPYIYPNKRRWIECSGGVLAIESPGTAFDLIELYDEIGLRQLTQDYFGEKSALLGAKWTLRKVTPKPHNADWHQDGAFMGKGIRSLDLWISLSHCGEDAPGLDIIPRRFNDLVKTGTDTAFADWTVGSEMAAEVGDGKIVRPTFRPGDAIFFDHLCLHRTAFSPEMSKARHAIESWFLAPSTYSQMRGKGKQTRVSQFLSQLPLVY